MIAIVSFPLKIIASDVKPPECVGNIQELVSCYAQKNGVNPKLAQYIVSNESNYDPNTIGDMKIKCPSTGKPVRSRGLVQISECYYPQITDSQAFDPNFALDFGMKLIKNKKVCEQQFTTCRNYYENI